MSPATRHPAESGDIDDLRSAIERLKAVPEYSPSIGARGVTCKTIFDCTYPWHLREHFVRARFRDVDPTPWAPDLFGGAGR